MTLALAVSVAAAVGAALRYLVDQVVQHQHDQTFPWGTFVINISGSLLLGLLTGLALHQELPAAVTTVLGVGLLGGYTTWSTYLWESLALAETGTIGQAALNVVGSLAAGFAAAGAGMALALL
jgi:fluoride exporter